MPFMDHMSLALRRALALQDTSVHDGMGHVAGHKPGYCFPAEVKPVTIPTDLTDRAVKARDQYLTDLASAWRNPTSKPATKPKPTQQQDGEQARAAYVQRISNAWKHP